IFKKNRTNFDTLAWYTGRLAIGVFDDAEPGGPIEVVEVNGEPLEEILSSRRSMSSLATKRRADEVNQPRGFTSAFLNNWRGAFLAEHAAIGDPLHHRTQRKDKTNRGSCDRT